ncbi:SafA/ExsA family spore coat assembly protein [Lentibacillus salicampi]|uniref:SafA/ExsA family spore coat assembly protein n=1 Tax=Lentibacillus salicampi TaxID=175306 RepID=A0A4Y9ADN4_9BACI|nr:SafA/ExsA family spore coat assembly protein [Lentibacillus salicampi]TFJ93999.1 SafA/ExsA family spore coat assembly protein [Lentibacillus salicampi]
MRIHIVQKGDTLWEIAKQYGADFEQVKQLNPQLSSPDMIMPGMKIKIPASSKPVKKEGTHKKEIQKETQMPSVEKPYKDTSPKPMPIMKEDDVKQPKEIKPKMPMQQKMSTVEQEMNYYNINLPQIPAYKKPEEESPEKQYYLPHPKPMLPMYQQEKCPPPPMPQVNPYSGWQQDCGCGGSKSKHMPMYQQPMPMPQVSPYSGWQQDCGCGGSKPKHMPMYQQPMHQQHHPMPMPQPMYHPQGHMPQTPFYGHMPKPDESSSKMEMPVKPKEHHNMNDFGSYSPKYAPNPMGMQQGYHYPQMPPTSHPHFAGDHMPMPKPPGSHGGFREDEEESTSE